MVLEGGTRHLPCCRFSQCRGHLRGAGLRLQLQQDVTEAGALHGLDSRQRRPPQGHGGSVRFCICTPLRNPNQDRPWAGPGRSPPLKTLRPFLPLGLGLGRTRLQDLRGLGRLPGSGCTWRPLLHGGGEEDPPVEFPSEVEGGPVYVGPQGFVWSHA